MLTSEGVIRRAGLSARSEYFDVQPVANGTAFSVKRRYPPRLPLSRVQSRNGAALLSCRIDFFVRPATAPGGVGRVLLRASLCDSREDPEDITPDSRALLARSRRPLDLIFRDEFAYDAGEDVFFDEDGRKADVAAMLDYAYEKHCRTCRWAFAQRWRVDSARRACVRWVVWQGQEALLWLLLNGYDIELVESKDEGLGSKLSRFRSPFHKYKYCEFRRITETAGQADRSQFFGFQSSRKSIFSNLTVLAFLYAVLYGLAPRWGFLTAIYNNTALTTAALIFAFLLADVLVPWLLIAAVLGLSRLRGAVLWFERKVPV